MHTQYQIPWKYGLECILLLVILMIQNAMAKPYNPSIWRGSISQSTYYYSDYKIPQAALQKRKFTPTPPNCPETGRTVCKEVERYPSFLCEAQLTQCHAIQCKIKQNKSIFYLDSTPSTGTTVAAQVCWSNKEYSTD